MYIYVLQFILQQWENLTISNIILESEPDLLPNPYLNRIR